MLRIYLASSWRNKSQQRFVRLLRDAGHEVYDFEHANYADSDTDKASVGFKREDVDANFRKWDVEAYQRGLNHQVSVKRIPA